MVTKDELFQQLKEDIRHDPPILTNITKLLQQFIEGLCRFCPSKHELNQQIRNSFPKEPNPENTQLVLAKLIFWIEKFQSPNDDKVTKKLLTQVLHNPSIDEIIVFLNSYYDHTEKVYKDVWDARQRLINGDNIIPPQHRQTTKGKNGIPFFMKTGI